MTPLIPHWVFHHRGIFANVPLVFAFFLTRGETQNTALAWSLGFGFLLLGMAVRVWAQQHIHHRLVKELELTRTGPYQIVRNPLYIGNTLLILGAVAFSKLLWLLPFALLWCVIFYSIIVHYEENGLAKHFGAPYLEYKARVPRWFPHRFPRLGDIHFTNEYLGRAVFAELQCFLILIPFVLKDLFLSSGHSL